MVRKTKASVNQNGGFIIFKPIGSEGVLMVVASKVRKWTTRTKHFAWAFLFLVSYGVSMISPFMPMPTASATQGSTHEVVCHRLGNGGSVAVPPNQQSAHIPNHVDENDITHSDYIVYATYPNNANWNDLKNTLDAKCVSDDPATPKDVTAPTFNEACGTVNDIYTIPTNQYATYKVNGYPKSAGTYAGTGTVSITAVPKAYSVYYYGHMYSWDYVLNPPTSWQFTFSNASCSGSITVTKVVNNNHGGTAQASDFDLYVNNTKVTSGASNVFAADQQYTVSESGGPSGYTQTSLICQDSTKKELSSTFTLLSDQNVFCTVVNEDSVATLIVKKHVVNDNGGTKTADQFTMNVTGANVSDDSFAGSENGVSVTLDAGNYSVNETQDSGYMKTLGADCSGAIAVGETKTCTITNDDIAPTLTLVKSVINDNGGSAKNTDWLLSAANNDDMSVVSGITGSAAVTKATVRSGTYTLSESNGPAGYTAKGWTCEGATVSGSTLTLGLGKNAVCTVTNDDDSPYLKLVKIVVNDDGGQASENDWLLSATGAGSANATSFSGQSGVNSSSIGGFQIGEYSLSESGGPTGYVAGSWSCEGADVQNGVISLILGQSATCTITNNDKPGTITVIKNVDDGFGHVTKDVQNWTWNYDGATKHKNSITTGSNNPQQVPAGTYTVSENQKPGYHVVASNCTNVYGDSYGTSERISEHQSYPTTSKKITVGLGQNVTCTFTNVRDTGTITVHKKIGDKIDPQGWRWWFGNIEGNSNPMGATKKVSTGWYDFGEREQQGYSFSSLKCKVDGHYVWVLQGAKSKIYVGRNDHVECVFVNTRDTGTVTIIKDAQPDSAQGFSFTIQPVAEDTEGDSRDSLVGDSPYQERVQSVIVGQTHHHDDQDDSEQPMSFTLVDNGTKDGKNTHVSVLPTGKYKVTEAVTKGWDLSAISCGDSDTSVSVEDGVVYIDVTKGAEITCTFTNTERAVLTVIKDAQPNVAKSFNFTSNIPDGLGAGTAFSLSDDGTNLTNSKTFDNLTPGVYTITEAATDAWKLDSISCTGTGVTMTREGYKLTVTLAAGAVASCTFVNSFVPQVLGDATVTPTLVNTGTDTIIGATIALILTAAAIVVVMQRRNAYVTVERK